MEVLLQFLKVNCILQCVSTATWTLVTVVVDESIFEYDMYYMCFSLLMEGSTLSPLLCIFASYLYCTLH